VTAGIVAQLQGELSLESLTIRNPGFRLDSRAPRPRIAPADLGVPGAQVAFDRKRNLASPAEARRKPYAKPFEERELGPIANRVADRERAQRQVEPQNGKPGAELRHTQAFHLAAFEPPDPWVGRTRRASARAKAQARGDSGFAVFATQAPKRIARAPSAAIRWTLTGRHSRRMDVGSALRIDCPLRHAYQRTIGGTAQRSDGPHRAPQRSNGSGGVTHDRSIRPRRSLGTP
jgi:hypothetical protein